mgnify:CR=1 FL=1
MLGTSSRAWKVNFCKFTNETRNGIEDSSRNSGIRFIAAVNGTCAGGGYELALACDEILLVDDRSSAVSLPEVPLLGVLPGTGGPTRIPDQPRGRHDPADIFCTTAGGGPGPRPPAGQLVEGGVNRGPVAHAGGERRRGGTGPAGDSVAQSGCRSGGWPARVCLRSRHQRVRGEHLDAMLGYQDCVLELG